MEVDSCPNQQDTEPCCSQNNAQSDSKNHAAKVPIKLYFDTASKPSDHREIRLHTVHRRRLLSGGIYPIRRRNIPKDDMNSLCRQMEDMNAHKGFKPCETERKKRILQRLRALVDSYKNKKDSEDDD